MIDTNMANPTSIDAYAALVLSGENAARVPIADTSATFDSEVAQPIPLAPPLQRPHYLIYEELINAELGFNKVVIQDE